VVEIQMGKETVRIEKGAHAHVIAYVVEKSPSRVFERVGESLGVSVASPAVRATHGRCMKSESHRGTEK
jgi:hypothetical protein